MEISYNVFFDTKNFNRRCESSEINMNEVHLVPVGFDRDRLVAPLADSGGFDPDRIILLTGRSTTSSEGDHRLAEEMLDRVEEDLRFRLDVDYETRELSDLHDFKRVYSAAIKVISDVLEEHPEADIWVNISSAPRPTSFGFANVMHTMVSSRPELRQQLHLYYARPNTYLATEMREHLGDAVDSISGTIEDITAATDRGEILIGEEGRDRLDHRVDDLIELHRELKEIRDRVNRSGITAGISEIEGRKYIELPLAAFPKLGGGAQSEDGLRKIEEDVLSALINEGPADSVKELTERLFEDSDQSNQSKVRYNVNLLEQKGFIELDSGGRSTRSEVNLLGEVWMEMQLAESPSS